MKLRMSTYAEARETLVQDPRAFIKNISRMLSETADTADPSNLRRQARALLLACNLLYGLQLEKEKAAKEAR